MKLFLKEENFNKNLNECVKNETLVVIIWPRGKAKKHLENLLLKNVLFNIN